MFLSERISDSAYQIDFEKMYRQGYRELFFDIDNTLVPHGLPADEARAGTVSASEKYRLQGDNALQQQRTAREDVL